MHWNESSTTRLFNQGDSIEVLVHQDDSVVILHDGGNIIRHLV